MLRTSAAIRTSAVLLCVGGLATATVHAGLLPRILSGGWEPNWTLGGKPVRLIEVPAAAPVGIGACPGVRPGAIVNSDVGQCTFNFLFEGDDGSDYIGTAGHCILGESPIGGDVGEVTWDPGFEPVALDADRVPIGNFVYAILEDPKDFALIRLNNQGEEEAEPQMCHFGGPTGINADMPSGPVVLNHYGNGIGIGSVLPARSGAAVGMPDPDHVFAAALALPGDSGSGVISADGRAVGVLVTVGVHSSSIGTGGVDAGTVGITRLTPQVERAEEVLGIDMRLQIADLL